MMAFQQASLETTLLQIAKQQQLAWYNAGDYKRLHIIEGCAHELAHALDLGPDFEMVLDSMTDKVANQHEAAALRIEVAALAKLGIRLSMRRLWASAKWYDEEAIPPLPQLHRPLNQHEDYCVKRFVALVLKTNGVIDERT